MLSNSTVKTETTINSYLAPLEVPLPTFDGTYEKWHSFKALFTTVMNRYRNEEPALKIFHLRKSLVGKAAGIIDDQLINNTDYEAASKLLELRYEDVRVVIEKHIENLFGLPRINQGDAKCIRKIIDVCTTNLEALKNHHLPLTGLAEQMLVNVISSKMDKRMRIAWETKQKRNVLPKYALLLEFLDDQFRIYEKLGAVAPPKPERVVHSLTVSEVQKCSLCEASHELWACDTFKGLNIKEKYEVLKKTGACYNCLARGHMTRKCLFGSCRKCGKKHHTQLHQNNQAREQEASAQTLCASGNNTCRQTILSTAMVLVNGQGKTQHLCRVLLDSASQMNFVTESFANLLSVKCEATEFTVGGLNGYKTKISKKLRTTVRIRDGKFATDVEFLVTPRITGELPITSFQINHWNLPNELELADPTFYKRGRIDMLLGAECFWDIVLDGRLEISKDCPILKNTKLGWIVGGVIEQNTKGVSKTFCQIIDDDPLPELLQRFYKLEACDELKASSSTSELECLDHFKRTHEKSSDGRYIVRLPFNERKRELGNSREMAMRRFLSLEKKLEKNLEEAYALFIKEYEQLGHMREIKEDPNEDARSAFYLPHHCVLRPSSTSTKLRVVFDGSAKSSTNVSINDVLMVGPMIQRDLTSILLRFRGFQFVLALDIPKMFRQVSVHPEDTKYQRIFWRNNSNDPLSVKELLTVTYGMTCSPFLATMALKQAAEDYKEEFPIAAEAILKGTYMDDILTGCDSLEEARQLQKELSMLLNRASFGAHKWCANHPDILQPIPTELRGHSFEVANENGKEIVKTLGVTWNPQEDWFSVSVPDFDDAQEITRRKLLSQLAKLFDPLGFFGPVLTYAKLILREVSELQIDWDDPVPSEICKRWMKFRNEIKDLKKIRLPRWILKQNALTLELHGFSDASDSAYGACLYAACFGSDEDATMNLIYSKSRILPKKRNTKEKSITTPRAELLAALLLAKIVEKFLNATDLQFESVYLWSDSQIVLAWLKKSPELLQIYVANRIREIQSITKKFHWRYVTTENNPADLISRGLSPRGLIRSKNWWQTRPIVSKHCAENEIVIPEEELPEMRIGVVLATTVSAERFPIFDAFSSFSKIVRSIAYMVRFIRFIKSRKTEVQKGQLTARELHDATLVVVRLVQQETFQPEIRAVREGKDSKHRLNGLKAFWDPKDHLLRVGGRIKRAVLAYDSRHQMLLPAKHPVTRALVRKLHLDNLHIGQRGLLAIVRQRFWPLNAKSTIRNVIRRCIVCFKANPLKTTQLMGDLPSYRVQPAPVFANTGVDYAGPFWIKSSIAHRKTTTSKAYVCLFVCLQTRALHLELVSDLTTDAFLAALRRFVSRRGCPKTIRSDNATNFSGAKSELHELWLLFQSENAIKEINGYCVNKGIEWSFIPPQSPHFGGIWEAGVKQVKHHLRRIVGDRNLSYEELYTTLTQIEAVLNSRPLVPSSDDPSDYTAITPAHFLIGRELTAIPEPDYCHIKENRLNRWQLIQSMLQHFWKRWTAEYLPELQNRQKWRTTKRIKDGSLVLLIDQNAPPLQWPLGRIIATHPGEDGATRVVTVKTATGTEFKRAVTQICLLPLDLED